MDKDDSNAPGPPLETQVRPGIPRERATSRSCVREKVGDKNDGQNEDTESEIRTFHKATEGNLEKRNIAHTGVGIARNKLVAVVLHCPNNAAQCR